MTESMLEMMKVSGAMEEELDDFDEDPDYEPAPSTYTRPSRPRKRQACTASAQLRMRPKASKQPRQEWTWRKTDLTGRQKDRFAWERQGYTFWVLTTPLGHTVQSEPYQGAKGRQAPECPGLGMGGAVVIGLISEIQNEDVYYHLTFDNLFTSLSLVDYLTSKGIACTGTIRSNRMEDCPLKSIQEMQKTTRGTYDFATDASTGLIAVERQQYCECCIEQSRPLPLHTAGRWSRSEKKKIQITQPFIIKHYNKTMGVVDRMDQNVIAYRVGIRSKKWWWLIFVYSLDFAVQQAWLLYRKTPASQRVPMYLAGRRVVVAKYLTQAPRQAVHVERPLGRHPSLDHRVPRAIRLDEKKTHMIQALGKQLRCAHCHGKSR